MITGEEDARPEVRILLELLDASQQTPATLRAWLRAGRPAPIDTLLRRDFAGFEDALAELAERGFILRRPGP